MTTVSAAGTAPTTANAASPATSKSNLDEAQDRFLKLLVTQMKNQDPLNPMDNAQVTTQMAQISTVSGISQLNDAINKLLGNVSDMESVQGASLAGHQALVSGNALTLAGGASAGAFELPAAADKVTMSVMDSAGRTVYSNTLGAQGPGMHKFSWDGTTTTGAKAADGQYTFKIDATAGSTTVAADSFAFGRVNGVTPASGGLQLDLGTLGIRAYNEVKEIQ
jgi:flagellar basal-body rod modification protein FlgD